MRIAYRYSKNPAEAEDVAQEALLRAWRNRSTLRDSGSRKQWLAAIVRNEAFRQYGRVRPDPVPTLEAEHGGEDERVLATVSASPTGRSRFACTACAPSCAASLRRCKAPQGEAGRPQAAAALRISAVAAPGPM